MISVEELEDIFDEAIESVRECAVDSDSFFTKDLTNEIAELYNIEERLKDLKYLFIQKRIESESDL